MDVEAVFGLAGDGKTAMAALERQKMCCLLACTPEHAKWLKHRLQAQVFKKFQDPQSKLHKPGLVNLLHRNLPVSGATPSHPPRLPKFLQLDSNLSSMFYSVCVSSLLFLESLHRPGW